MKVKLLYPKILNVRFLYAFYHFISIEKVSRVHRWNTFEVCFFFPLIIKMLNPDSYILLTSFFWNDSGEKKQSKQHFWRESQLDCSLKVCPSVVCLRRSAEGQRKKPSFKPMRPWISLNLQKTDSSILKNFALRA